MDSRFHIKIEFSIYGDDHKWEASLNWYPGMGDCDDRIVEWFAERHAESYARYSALISADAIKRKAQEAEREERAQLARLKAKYEPENHDEQ